MNITVTGVNYKTTPLNIREMLSFNMDEQKEALVKVRRLLNVDECVLISTCNRTEVYIYSKVRDFDSSSIEQVLCQIKGLSLYSLKKYFYTYRGEKTVKHLFKVACGLDSMVLGEDQILGQVKSAHSTSLEIGTGASILNTLFRNAVTVAKKVKTGTELSKNSLSIGSLAVKFLTEICGDDLSKKSALIIGTGKIGRIAFKNLLSKGIGEVYITNRSHGKLQDIMFRYPTAKIVEYDDRYSAIDICDVIISSTSSPHYTITKDVLDDTVKTSKKRIFIDLAVPRDIDESIIESDDVEYFNIDDLQSVSAENLGNRMIEATRAEKIIDEHIVEFEKWYEFKKALPIVEDLKKYTDWIMIKRMENILERLENVSEEDKNLIRIAMSDSVSEIINTFVYGVRQKGTKEDIRVYFNCLKEAVKDKYT